jgi:hypothetical protein
MIVTSVARLRYGSDKDGTGTCLMQTCMYTVVSLFGFVMQVRDASCKVTKKYFGLPVPLVTSEYNRK